MGAQALHTEAPRQVKQAKQARALTTAVFYITVSGYLPVSQALHNRNGSGSPELHVSDLLQSEAFSARL